MTKTNTRLAFVLLPDAQMPPAERIEAAFAEFALEGEAIEIRGAQPDAFEFTFASGRSGGAVFVPAPVPDREADEALAFSLSALHEDETLAPHAAHLGVFVRDGSATSTLESMSEFTTLLAAFVKASDAVGVYWGSVPVSHGAQFFLEVAATKDAGSRVLLFTGINAASENGEVSYLSSGMKEFALPDLLLVEPPDYQGNAIEMFFDLLVHVIERGEALPDGDTIGCSEEQRLEVRYVTSPIDEDERVWRVELR